MMKKMNKIYAILLLLLAVVTMSSCEKILNIDESEIAETMQINAYAVTGENFKLSLSGVKRIGSSMFIPTIDNAVVEIEVNGVEVKDINWNTDKTECSTPTYVCKEGDKINVKVTAPNYKTVRATTIVPTSPLDFEVLDTAKVYCVAPLVNQGSALVIDEYALDSVLTIKMKLYDKPNEKNYYRLVVKSVANKSQTIMTQVINEVFGSEDDLFADPYIVKSVNGWQPFFSNVFDDELFDGKDCTITVSSQLRNGYNKRVVIEYQLLSEDLYHYLKSVQVQKAAATDIYADPIIIYSNVIDGVGILGAYNFARQTIIVK